jgi:hypothetical protein
MGAVTLNNARYEVEGKREFFVRNPNTHSGSVFTDKTNDLYIVYSYGHHFPMYVYDYAIGKWIGNSSKYSVTTSKQQSKTRPNNVSFWLDNDEMKAMIYKGGFVEYKLREVA